MKLNKLVNIKSNINIKGIKTNSKDIKKGDIFVCGLGLIDKHQYINDAISKGCRFVITKRDISDNISYLKTNNIDLTLKELLDKFYHNPLDNINLVGVTGTDGKTTTVSVIRDMLNGASLGTNGLEYKNKKVELHNTTPSLDKLYECFDVINKEKIKDLIMEVSSESYLTNRIPYLKFNIGIFTNITKEHLDKHKDFNNYFLCKMKLLDNSNLCIINHDSKYYKDIIKHCRNYVTYGKKKSTLTIKKYLLEIDKTIICFSYKNNIYEVNSPLRGEFNVYNLMSAILCLLCLNYDILDIINRISLIKQVPGRMEIVYNGEYQVIIDYAHTINATRNILEFVSKHHKGRIITVLGCAGGRYRDKRKLIGNMALKYSNKVIFTMDDPRNEDVNDIIDDMISSTKYHNYERIIERNKAIERALSIAKKQDLVLILGKGRDNYMAIDNQYIPYSDIMVIDQYLRK